LSVAEVGTFTDAQDRLGGRQRPARNLDMTGPWRAKCPCQRDGRFYNPKVHDQRRFGKRAWEDVAANRWYADGLETGQRRV
jgi:hypothetical protein